MEKQSNYDIVALACERLSYRDKLKLAQLLIQLARKEEEIENPQKRLLQEEITTPTTSSSQSTSATSIENINYAKERILKLKPTKKKTLLNSIKSMFNFRGGISEKEQESIIKELEKQKIIKIENTKVLYL
jgi:hypothetical protein